MHEGMEYAQQVYGCYLTLEAREKENSARVAIQSDVGYLEKSTDKCIVKFNKSEHKVLYYDWNSSVQQFIVHNEIGRSSAGERMGTHDVWGNDGKVASVVLWEDKGKLPATARWENADQMQQDQVKRVELYNSRRKDGKCNLECKN